MRHDPAKSHGHYYVRPAGEFPPAQAVGRYYTRRPAKPGIL